MDALGIKHVNGKCDRLVPEEFLKFITSDKFHNGVNL